LVESICQDPYRGGPLLNNSKNTSKLSLSVFLILIYSSVLVSCTESNDRNKITIATVQVTQKEDNKANGVPALTATPHTGTPNPGLENEIISTEYILSKGEYILFSQNSQIKALSEDNKIFTILEELPIDTFVLGIAFSRDLSKIAYINFTNSESIQFMELRSNKRWSLNIEKYCQGTSPRVGSWSPDGNYISIICDQIYVVNVNNGDVIQISNMDLPTRFRSASWSPDGKMIFYNFIPDMSYGKYTGFEGQYLADVAINNNDQVEVGDTKFWDFDTYSCNYEWSSDGSYLINGNYPVIHAFKLSDFGLKSRLINIEFEHNFDPDNMFPELCVHWSPSSNEIAFSHGRVLAKTSLMDGKIENLVYSVDYILDWICYPGEDENYCKGKKENVVDFYFDIGKRYIITINGNNLNLRAEPDMESAILEQLKTGEEITILDGPTHTEDGVWWYVNEEKSGIKGWIVENKDWIEVLKD